MTTQYTLITSLSHTHIHTAGNTRSTTFSHHLLQSIFEPVQQKKDMNTQTLLKIFLDGAGLYAADDNDAITIGDLQPSYSPAGVNSVMNYFTKYTDGILEISTLPLSTIIELRVIRGFTFREYQELFSLTIKEKDFSQYAAFRALFIVTEKQRRTLIYLLNKDDYEEGYLSLLARVLQTSNPFLFSFLFVYED